MTYPASFNSGANALVMLASLNQPTIECLTLAYMISLTWDEWSYPQLLSLWGISDPRIVEPSFEQQKTEHVRG